MSLYQVDKVFREVVIQPEQRRRYLEEPAAFLVGRDLTPEEHQALMQRDYAALYRMGGHPFLLWGWLATINPQAMPKLLGEYCKAIKPHGYPDWAT